MSIVVPLTTLILGCIAVGGGWTIALSLNRSLPLFSATSFLFSMAIAIFSWDWIYPLGGKVKDVNLLIFIVSVLGWFCAGYKIKKRTNTEKITEKLKTNQTDWLIIPLALVVAFFFGLFPKMDSATSLTMSFRTGPDAIGTAIASEALLRDGSKSALTQKIVNNSSFGSLEILFTDSNLYRITSFSQQVKTEFILSSAPKIGVTGVTANVMDLIGLQYLWAILALLPTLGLFLSILLIFESLRANDIPILMSISAAIGGAVNVNALHLWHEGSIAQTVVSFPFITMVVLIFAPRHLISHFQKIALSTASSIIIFSHTEMFLVLGLLLVISLIVTLPKRNFAIYKKNICYQLLALFSGAITCGPYFANWIRNFVDRLSELGPGGWNMAVWPNLSDIFGLVNPYKMLYPNLGRVSRIETFLAEVFTIIMVSFMTIIILKSKSYLPKLFFAAIFLVLFFVLFKVIVFDHATNYQYIKAVGALAPLLLPLIALTLSQDLRSYALARLALPLICICVLVASTSYVIQYRQSSTRIGHDLQKTLIDLNRDGYLDEIDFVSRNRMEEWAFAPFVDLRLIGRGTGGVDQKIVQHKKLGLILKESECKNWQCLSNSPKSNIVEVNSDYRILLLDTTSNAIYKKNKLRTDYISIINRFSLEVQGPTFHKEFKIISN